MKKYLFILFGIIFLFCIQKTEENKEISRQKETDFEITWQERIQEKTKEPVCDFFYTDFTGDGHNSAFIFMSGDI